MLAEAGAGAVRSGMRIDEDHQREQYFFDGPTARRLADVLSSFERPCCLCTPKVGQVLADRDRWCRVLDIDERFSAVPGFSTFDLYRPEATGEAYDVILCDPPFGRVSLSQLFDAVRVLTGGDTDHRIAICYLVRRAPALLGTFAPFGLAPTGVRLGYVSVRPIAENHIELYANFDLPPAG